MRENGINKLKARRRKCVIDKNNIKNFVKLMNRRDIRKGKVNKLMRVLEKGEHFETPIMTNVRGKEERLLDGNHRIEAIVKYFKKYPNRKVELCVFYYDNLTDEEERKIYTKWNLGTKQNTNDFVKQYWSSIPIVKKMKSNAFPWNVSHCWTSNAIEFKTLVGAYLTKNDKIFYGQYTNSAMDFIEDSKGLNGEDYKKIREFLKEYIHIFGNPNRKNMHYKSVVFTAIARIWNDNLNLMSYRDIRTAFTKLRGHERIVYFTQFASGTRDSCIQCRKDLLDVINGQRTKNPFV